jgi:predicted RNase H-like HicB family nuclease
MRLRVQEFIEKKLGKAEYEFDKSVKEWAGWIKGLPGIYAQASSIEEARNQLAEMLEEYLLISVQEKKRLKDFDIVPKVYAKSYC